MTTSDDAVRNPNPDRPDGDAAADSPPPSCPEDVAHELIEFLEAAGPLLGGGRLTPDELTQRRERIERAAQQRLAAEADTAPAHVPLPRHDQPATGPKDSTPIPAGKLVAADEGRAATEDPNYNDHHRWSR